jgi:hypothetical protein
MSSVPHATLCSDRAQRREEHIGAPGHVVFAGAMEVVAGPGPGRVSLKGAGRECHTWLVVRRPTAGPPLPRQRQGGPDTGAMSLREKKQDPRYHDPGPEGRGAGACECAGASGGSAIACGPPATVLTPLGRHLAHGGPCRSLAHPEATGWRAPALPEPPGGRRLGQGTSLGAQARATSTLSSPSTGSIPLR